MNWYYSEESIKTMTPNNWTSMNLPMRLYDLFMQSLEKNEHVFLQEKRFQDIGKMEIEYSKDSRSVNKELEKLSLGSNEDNVEVKEVDKKGGEEKVKQDDVQKENNVISESKWKEIHLKQFIEGVEDFEDALHILNQEGEKEGLKFKKGNIQYYSDKTPKYRAIICACKNRHAKTKIPQDRCKDSLDNSKIKEVEASENGNCPVFYRFKFKKNQMELISFDESHSNHEFKIKKDILREDMIRDIACFTKNTSVSEIRDFLEKKYKVDLSYNLVYAHFRKIFPLLGPQEASIFIKLCEENEFQVDKCMDEINRITKLFICTNLMKAHYKAYSDVVLIDATYRINKYKLPVVIFSGYTHKGRNCIFGIGIVNDEKETTYQWLFEKFFAAHNDLPLFMVTDHDSSITAVIEKNYKSIIHLLCLWHIIQNFSKNFNFLLAMNHNTIKANIMKLPYIETKEEFERVYDLVQKDLKEKKYSKSSNYLNGMWKIKEKWARAYIPLRFTGGTRTTSRAESINALIKKYVSSKNEICDFLDFVSSFEKKSIFDNLKKEKEYIEQYETHPIIRELKAKIFDHIYDNHFSEFTLSHNYFIKVLKVEENIVTYEVKSIQSKDENKYREVTLLEGKYVCSCDTFIRDGIICRHIFAISNVNQDKTLEKLTIHNRWLPPQINSNGFNLQIDNYNFNTNLVSKYLEKNFQPIEKDKKLKEKDDDDGEDKISFQVNSKVKGAPRKEKRIKNAIEKKKTKNSKKSNDYLFIY